MWIAYTNRVNRTKGLLNIDKVTEIVVTKTPDGNKYDEEMGKPFYSILVVNEDSDELHVAVYPDLERANDVLRLIVSAMKDGDGVVTLPPSVAPPMESKE